MGTKEIFAKRVNELRKAKGINQAQLAERVGVSKTSANLYESATRAPDIQVLARYAKVLGVTSDYLLGLSDNRTQGNAAIGDKLGLSDESIEMLSGLSEQMKEAIEDSRETAKSIPEYQVQELLYIYSPLRVINSIITDRRLSGAIQQYLLGSNNAIIESVDIKELQTNIFRTKDEINDELREANDALNMYRVQKALIELKEEYQKTTPKPIHFDIVITEDNNAKENKCKK